MYMIYLNFVIHAFNAIASDTSVSIKPYNVSFQKIFYSKLRAAFN